MLNVVTYSSTVVVDGEINTISAIQHLKEHFHSLRNHPELIVVLKDANSIPSSVLGMLIKLAKVDGKEVVLKIKNNDVLEGLKELRLDEAIKLEIFDRYLHG